MPIHEGENRGENPETYSHSVRYSGSRGERESNRAYRSARQEIYESDADLSVFRLMGQIGWVGWYVALIGAQPPQELEQKLLGHLDRGDEVTLPDEVLDVLRERRREAARIAPWVERRNNQGSRRKRW